MFVTEQLADFRRVYAPSLTIETDGGAMHQTNDAIWLAFEALAKTYPHDGGVRITTDPARWLLEERQRLNLPAPPIIEEVVRMVAKQPDLPVVGPVRATPVIRR